MAQVAIITASDSGIGKECALLLAQQGFDLAFQPDQQHGPTQRQNQRQCQPDAKKN